MSLILTSRRICSQVLINARSTFWLPKNCINTCQQLNTEHDSDSSDSEQSRQSKRESTESKHDSKSTSPEDDTKHKILTAALDFVPIHGWTTESIAEGAKLQGLPAVSHGMFPRGGGDLVHHFVRECNDELADRLDAEVQEMEQEEEEGKTRRKTGAFIRDALETRLRMIIPYVDSWPQAMALAALPSNIEDHFANLSQLMDDIWYYAGDKSTDFNWYTKRFSLAVVYKSTELHLVQDESEDFQETWSFMDRRLADVAFFGSFKTNLESSMTDIEKIASAAFTTGRNIVGLNERRR
ncbi:ubiquinone biosynthesis protein COQ9, mitochondrial-like [Amphiura filiformis]|uniref:ubiquinone biosynthesis protein COQ9, mitochondrial-like n=1 Tax=Amphiura filiformis TaxID=82378 RepID=UPI003B20BA56